MIYIITENSGSTVGSYGLVVCAAVTMATNVKRSAQIRYLDEPLEHEANNQSEYPTITQAIFNLSRISQNDFHQ